MAFACIYFRECCSRDWANIYSLGLGYCKSIRKCFCSHLHSVVTCTWELENWVWCSRNICRVARSEIPFKFHVTASYRRSVVKFYVITITDFGWECKIRLDGWVNQQVALDDGITTIGKVSQLQVHGNHAVFQVYIAGSEGIFHIIRTGRVLRDRSAGHRSTACRSSISSCSPFHTVIRISIRTWRIDIVDRFFVNYRYVVLFTCLVNGLTWSSREVPLRSTWSSLNNRVKDK